MLQASKYARIIQGSRTSQNLLILIFDNDSLRAQSRPRRGKGCMQPSSGQYRQRLVCIFNLRHRIQNEDDRFILPGADLAQAVSIDTGIAVSLRKP